MTAPLIYLIAGEASGDLLGGGLMEAIQQRMPAINFAGIGGERMMVQGLQPLFPMADLSVMGLVEVLAHLPRLMRRIDETVADILAKKPAVVVGIDAPDFCFRVEARVRAADPSIKLVHYVAPSVWAWRPGRAKKIAKFLDHLLALLPFEPPYFTAVGLPCTFVGHPATSDTLTGDAQRFRAAHNISDSQRIVLLLPGSRRGEVSRILPLCLAVARGLAQRHDDLIFVLPTIAYLTPLLQENLAGFAPRHILVEGKQAKADAFTAAHAALAASGTVALELALAGVPAVICYKLSPLTGFLARRLVKAAFASLPNLILGREVMPEFIHPFAKPELILPAMEAVLRDGPAREVQIAATEEIARMLQPQGQDPNAVAAEVVSQFCHSERSEESS